ncbi:hypothetical protein FGO68_gene2401 [Halteria grandinella]|uniref:Uncharacterized protein n=1 Tax=Halteria grandinella TaxID=5974 RepID=A0A8J8T7L5_HALGN|nr:hypothetical protein FGO68_gene2401 [Halteria grandinella]
MIVNEGFVTTEIKLKILGLKSKELNDILKSLFQKAIGLPSNWEQIGGLITGQNELQIYSLEKGSPEWNKVHNKFNASMPASEVIRVERIQNIKLWNCFEKETQEYVKIDTRELFYGSKNMPPEDIYKGENGFKTLWNQGIREVHKYFAKNSYYCSINCYRVPHTTDKQMFLATVIDCTKLQEDPDASVRKPQPTEKSEESMSGDYADLYTISSKYKAYPSYLITYQ